MMRTETNVGMLGSIAAASLVVGIASTAFGQDSDQVRRMERQMRELDLTYRLKAPSDQPIDERLLLDYGAIARISLYSIDDAFSESRVLRQYDGRAYVRAELDGAHRFYARLRFQYDDWNTGDSFDGRGDEFTDPIGEQYWYQFDYRGLKMSSDGSRPDWNFNVKVGRQFIDWGSGMMLSNLMYAMLADVEIANIGLTGLAAYATDHDTIDFDGSRPDFDTENDRAFFGGKIEYRGLPNHRPYAFGILEEDHNNDVVTFSSIAGLYPTQFRYDANYVGVGSTGSIGSSFLYKAELVHQFGEGMSSSFDPVTLGALTQTVEDIDAWAVIAGLTYLFQDVHDTRLELEMAAGSGDDDRLDSSDTFGGNAPGTDDQAFNGWGYVNTGLASRARYFKPCVDAIDGKFDTVPHAGFFKGVRLTASGYLFTKIDSDAPVNVTTTDDSFMGGEIDVGLDWRFTSDLSLILRYGVFLPGEAMPTGQDDPRHFFFTGVTYAF